MATGGGNTTGSREPECFEGGPNLEALDVCRLAMDRVSDAVFCVNAEAGFDYVNREACDSLHYSQSELLSLRVHDIDPGLPARLWPRFWPEIVRRKALKRDSTHRRRDGTTFPVELRMTTLSVRGTPYVLALARDRTKQETTEKALRASETQLQRAQRLEAVALLAGGVAHDFNNLLTVVGGNSDLLTSTEASLSKEGRQRLVEIAHAARRGANLTNQLLAFSRRQAMQPRSIWFDALLQDLRSMLSRLIGEHIELVTRFGAGGAHVYADPAQMEQVVMNLVVNARDAMPGGGRLEIRTDVVGIGLDEPGEDGTRPDHELSPGRYVRLTVEDSGAGIGTDALAHIFEPFFTTKRGERGTGTGLGLSTAYGIVKQSGGAIQVESERDVGSAFRVLLPLAETERTAGAEQR